MLGNNSLWKNILWCRAPEWEKGVGCSTRLFTCTLRFSRVHTYSSTWRTNKVHKHETSTYIQINLAAQFMPYIMTGSLDRSECSILISIKTYNACLQYSKTIILYLNLFHLFHFQNVFPLENCPFTSVNFADFNSPFIPLIPFSEGISLQNCPFTSINFADFNILYMHFQSLRLKILRNHKAKMILRQSQNKFLSFLELVRSFKVLFSETSICSCDIHLFLHCQFSLEYNSILWC